MKGLCAVLLFGLLGCGGNPLRTRTTTLNATPSTVSGFVSTVQFNQAATSQGSNSAVTVVTFIPQVPQTSPTTNITFCGNVVNEFVPNTFATVTFTPGQGCSSIVSLAPISFVALSGFISIVQVTVSGNDSLVTTVTFLLPAPQNGLAETIAFCGNVGNQFAMNGFMTVTFTQAIGCANIVAVASR
jgi:hypothetical protein